MSVVPEEKSTEGVCDSTKEKGREQKTSKWVLCLKYVPYINSAYDLVFDKTPNCDSVKDLLNLIGLIDALMLGIVFSVVTAVDFDSAIEADERFMVPSDDPDKNGYYELYESNDSVRANEEFGAPSASFLSDCGIGISCLFNSLVVILLTYMDIVHKDFDAYTPAKREKLMESWWKAGRFLIIASLALAYFGVVYSIASVVPLIYINFPDYKVEAEGKLIRQANAPYEYVQWLLNTGWIIFHSSIIVMGIGTGLRYHEEQKQKSAEDKIHQTDIMTKSAKEWNIFFQQEHIALYFHDVAEEYILLLTDAMVDFDDRSVITDQHLQSIGIERVGHRAKLLRLFAQEFNAHEVATVKTNNGDEKNENLRNEPHMTVEDVNRDDDIDNNSENEKTRDLKK